jgi:hypothetical protein
MSPTHRSTRNAAFLPVAEARGILRRFMVIFKPRPRRYSLLLEPGQSISFHGKWRMNKFELEIEEFHGSYTLLVNLAAGKDAEGSDRSDSMETHWAESSDPHADGVPLVRTFSIFSPEREEWLFWHSLSAFPLSKALCRRGY